MNSVVVFYNVRVLVINGFVDMDVMTHKGVLNHLKIQLPGETKDAPLHITPANPSMLVLFNWFALSEGEKRALQ